MSKTITIPSDNGDPVVVLLNGVKYTYKAGDTVTVPDEVAALLESNDANAVIFGRRAAAALEAPIRKGSVAGVPIATDDSGKMYAPVHVEGHKLIFANEG